MSDRARDQAISSLEAAWDRVTVDAAKLDRIRAAAQTALDEGCATGSAVTLAQRILSLLEGT